MVIGHNIAAPVNDNARAQRSTIWRRDFHFHDCGAYPGNHSLAHSFYVIPCERWNGYSRICARLQYASAGFINGRGRGTPAIFPTGK